MKRTYMFWKKKEKKSEQLETSYSRVDSAKIELNGITIKCPIENHKFQDLIRIGDRYVVCCVPPVNSEIAVHPRNIIAYDASGNILWTNEPINMNYERECFLGVNLWKYEEWSYFYKDEPKILKKMAKTPRLYGASFLGSRYEIDIQTGKIVDVFFTRGR